MGLSIGIVGLPNVGKSTLFNAITKNQVQAENYPFCTIDPNVGVVGVPDDRLGKLAEVIPTKQIVPAVVEFVDIAGLVRGAAQGEGLGNQFLSHIRACDAIAEVIRVFSDSKVMHVEGKLDPVSDMETIKTELILADLETVRKRREKLEKELKANPKTQEDLDTVKVVEEKLDNGISARDMGLSEKEIAKIRDLNLLTAKPHIYVFNGDESHLKNFDPSSVILTNAGISKKELDPRIREDDEKERDEKKRNINHNNFVVISAKIEGELNQLSEAEKNEYLAELGQKGSGLDNLIKKSFSLLGLATYFTAGEKEIKAWTIHQGWTAPQAAGVIHGDFERGFIKAETVCWQDLYEQKGWAGAKSAGKVRLEGRDYVVRDGDVMIFKFNV